MRTKKSNTQNRNNLARNKGFRDFRARQSRVLLDNCEYVHDETGKIVKGKAPNLKRVKDFYKKVAKHRMTHGKKH